MWIGLAQYQRTRIIMLGGCITTHQNSCKMSVFLPLTAWGWTLQSWIILETRDFSAYLIVCISFLCLTAF